MEKEARKKSNDPKQESLRTAKDKWNLAAKEFISRMIAFKRGLNGRGDGHYSLPPSNIKDPLPSQIVGFLNTLSTNFEQLAREAETIERAQEEYSKTRRHAQPKVATASVATRKAQVQIGQHQVEALIAETFEEQAMGLMHQPWPPPAMVFTYASPQVNQFWMKSTPSPLDIIFALNGKILSIKKGEPNSTTLIGGYELSDLVVELPFGTCIELGIRQGDPIRVNKQG